MRGAQHRDRRRRRRIATVSVHHQRHPEAFEKLRLHGFHEGFGLGQVAAADQDCGIALVLRRTGKDRAFHQREAIVGSHSAVGQDGIRPPVVSDHLVESGGLGVRV